MGRNSNSSWDEIAIVRTGRKTLAFFLLSGVQEFVCDSSCEGTFQTCFKIGHHTYCCNCTPCRFHPFSKHPSYITIWGIATILLQIAVEWWETAIDDDHDQDRLPKDVLHTWSWSKFPQENLLHMWSCVVLWNFGPAPLPKYVGEFCCINFGSFCRGFLSKIFRGTFSHKNVGKKSGDKIHKKIRRPKNKNPQKIRPAKNER